MTNLVRIETLLAILIISNLLILGSSRIRKCVMVLSVQGIAVGILPVIMEGNNNITTAIIVSILSITLKGIIFPKLIISVLQKTEIKKETKPFVGYSPSILIGISLLIFSLWAVSRLEFLEQTRINSITIAVGLTTLLVGLFIIISRHNAVNQVIGYIIMENGIYTFGLSIVSGLPLLFELGALLDIFVAVFIMSIATYHIKLEFDHINVDRLDSLKG